MTATGKPLRSLFLGLFYYSVDALFFENINESGRGHKLMAFCWNAC